MSHCQERANDDDHELGLLSAKAVSRREFLKIAGIAGATVGLGAGLGGLAAACGSGEETTTTAAGSITTAVSTGSTTAVSAAAETGREIKLGFPTPQTGPLALFGVPDLYCADRWKEAIGTGLVLGDGKNHPISITAVDTQSDSNRAATVAGDLINNTNVDMMMVASTPDTVTPVVEQCEVAGVPCFSTDCPWQTYLGTRFPDGYKWGFHIFFGGEDTVAAVAQVVQKVPTNKVMGLLMPNDADGNFYREQDLKGFPEYGYKMVDGGAYQNGTEDYTSIISKFKSAGVESLVAVPIPPDFTNFWKQAIQQSWIPKFAYIGKACLFPESVGALGAVGNGICTDLWWSTVFPFKSSLTGETCPEFADEFVKRTNQQWTQPLLHYVVGEMALWTLKNAKDPTSKDSLLEAAITMKLDTIFGPIDFSASLVTPTGTGNADFPPGPGHVVKSVWDSGVSVGQWLMKGGKYDFELVALGNASFPYLTDDMLSVPVPLPVKS